MARKLTHVIFVVGNEARVVTSRTADRLDPGDIVMFESEGDGQESVIRYPNGHPFESPCAVDNGNLYAVKLGNVFTVKVACSDEAPFMADCGRKVAGNFVKWSPMRTHKPALGTPGPDD